MILVGESTYFLSNLKQKLIPSVNIGRSLTGTKKVYNVCTKKVYISKILNQLGKSIKKTEFLVLL